MKNEYGTPEWRKEFDAKYQNTQKSQGHKKIWNYFLDLSKTTEFKNEILGFRAELAKIREMKNSIESYKKYKDYINKIDSFAIRNSLDPNYWQETLEIYISENELNEPEGIDVCRILSIAELSESLENINESELSYSITPMSDVIENYNKTKNIYENYPIVILVHRQATLRDINDFISKNFDLAITPLKKAFSDKKVLDIGKSKRKSTTIQKRNEYIYENRSLSRKEIVGLVSKKFGKAHILDYDYVGKIIREEKRKRKDA
jgi:hypothetical protein